MIDTPWPGFALISIAAGSCLLCVIFVGLSMGLEWLEIEYSGGNCDSTYDVYLYNGLCRGSNCVSWSSTFWEEFSLANDAETVWPSAGVLLATSMLFTACAFVMSSLAALSLVSLRLGQLAILANMSIAVICAITSVALVTGSTSMDPDAWAPVRDKLAHNFEITFTCDTIVKTRAAIPLAWIAALIQATCILLMAFPGCCGHCPDMVYGGHMKLVSAIDEDDEEMKL